MTCCGVTSSRGLYRNTDRALLGGVCAGLADYFGFNLKVTRILVFIAFLMAMPVTVLAYLAAMCLIPARSEKRDRAPDPEFRRTLRASPAQAANDLRRRFQALDRRLARMEKFVTSPRYQLEKEFRDL